MCKNLIKSSSKNPGVPLDVRYYVNCILQMDIQILPFNKHTIYRITYLKEEKIIK